MDTIYTDRKQAYETANNLRLGVNQYWLVVPLGSGHYRIDVYGKPSRSLVTTRIENRWIVIDDDIQSTLLDFLAFNEFERQELDDLLNLEVGDTVTLNWMTFPSIERIA